MHQGFARTPSLQFAIRTHCSFLNRPYLLRRLHALHGTAKFNEHELLLVLQPLFPSCFELQKETVAYVGSHSFITMINAQENFSFGFRAIVPVSPLGAVRPVALSPAVVD